jgi:hypothetical protein
VSNDLESFLAGKTTAAKFEDRDYGRVIGGEIIGEPQMLQQRDYTTGDLMFYPDGNPQMQMVVRVQAQPATSDDDGVRALYIKGQMREAVITALKTAGERVPRKGGTLQVKYLRDEPVTLKNGRPGNPQKIYAARYAAPVGAAGDFLSAAAAAPAVAYDNPPARVVQAGGPQNTESRRPAPEGVDPARWAAMSDEQQRQMHVALGYGQPEPVAAATGFRDEPPF